MPSFIFEPNCSRDILFVLFKFRNKKNSLPADTTDCYTQTDPPVEMESPVVSAVDKQHSVIDTVSTVEVIPESPIIVRRRSPKVIFMSGITILALLAIFTFFGGVEYGDRVQF